MVLVVSRCGGSGSDHLVLADDRDGVFVMASSISAVPQRYFRFIGARGCAYATVAPTAAQSFSSDPESYWSILLAAMLNFA